MVKKLCLQQKRSLNELTEQHLSLQQQNHKLKVESHTLVEKNLSLQTKLKRLEELNQNYSQIITGNVLFDEDNDLTIPKTPEKYNKHNPKKKEQMLDNIVTPDMPTKRKNQSNDNQPQLRRSVRMKVNISRKQKWRDSQSEQYDYCRQLICDNMSTPQ